jgi:ABC-type multidrug transport system ATPase subunit
LPAGIQTHGFTKRFGDVLAVEGVNLRVEYGEVYDFLGPNGTGNTTTIRALLGMITPSAGSVALLGKPIGPGARGPWKWVGYLQEANIAILDRLRAILQRSRRHAGSTD